MRIITSAKFENKERLSVAKIPNSINYNSELDCESCQVIKLPKISDKRGSLTVIENNKNIPFEVKRVYYIYDVPSGEKRAGHAHKALHQLIVAISGSFDVVIDDGYERKTFHLNCASHGLYIPPMVWRDIMNFSSGAVCVALASNFYDESDYYRNYQDFIKSIEGET